MGYVEESICDLRRIGLKSASSGLEALLNYGKGELFVLNYLYFQDKTTTPSELSKALGSTPARISAILKVLEKKGEILREVDRSNRSYVLVTLTDAGRARAERIVTSLDRTMTSVLYEMGEEDALQFLRLANRFVDLLQKYSIEPQWEDV